MRKQNNVPRIPLYFLTMIGYLCCAQIAARAENLLLNPDFDLHVVPWTTSQGSITWDTLDVNGSQFSGSMKIVTGNFGADALSECLPVDDPNIPYHLSGSFYVASGQSGGLLLRAAWYSTADCNSILAYTGTNNFIPTFNTWFEKFIELTPFGGAQSVRMDIRTFGLLKPDPTTKATTGSLTVFADNLKLTDNPWLSFQDETAGRLVLSGAVDPSREKDMAAADLDHDGWTDVVVVLKQPFSSPGAFPDLLLMNQGGTLVDRTADFAPEFFTEPTDARDVFILDFTADGWQDVVIANTFEQQPKLYVNQRTDAQGNWLGLVDESSRLPTIGVGPLQFCAVWGGDVTGNGAPDIYLSNYNQFGTALDVLLVNDGIGNFTDESSTRLGGLRNSAFGTSVEIHDVDNDGDRDIIKTSTLNSVPPWNQRGVFILFNDGSGTFTSWQKANSSNPYMFTVADFTQDSMRDIYIVDDFQDYVDLATNVQPPIYNQVTLMDSPRTTGFGGNVKAADLDNDGDFDAGVADVDVDIPPCESGREFALLRNNGIATGDLTDPWGSIKNPWNESVYDFLLLDIDNDGQTDLFQGRCLDFKVFIQP